ncbi:MAG: hypothetical protein ACEPOZ_01465 [Marinifilaceae bacterium]
MLKKYILGIVILGLGTSQSFAQTQRDLHQEVKVVKAYQPVISDAQRISELPKIVDTVRFVPTFTYHVHTSPLSENYEPLPIKAAKMVGEPLKALQGNHLKLGGGNYSTLFADYRYNNTRSRKYDLGVHLGHYSTNGKVTLENDTKEKATYSNQLAEVTGKVFLKEALIDGKVFYNRNEHRYYGFPNTLGSGTLINASGETNLNGKQNFQHFGFEGGYSSHFRDEDQLNYSVGISYNHFKDKFAVKEDALQIKGTTLQRKNDAFWGIEGAATIYNTKGLHYFDEDGKLQENRKSGFIKFNPYYLLRPGKWSIRLGVATYMGIGDDSDLKLYPDLNFEFQAIDHILTLFAGLNGALEFNDYQKIAKENPFVYTGLNVENTDHQFHVFGGMKGNLASNASFRLSGEYSILKDQYFFANRSGLSANEKALLPVGVFANQFGVVYDDMDLLKLSADFNLEWNEKLNMGAGVNVYHYAMDEQEKAWHKPSFDVRIDADYRMNSEWQFSAEVYVLGERYAFRGGDPRKLDGVYDLNLGGNYQISEVFSGFVNLNNVLADKNYRWDGYPTLGFNALLGVAARF